MLAGEETAGASETRHDLVENEEDSVPVAPFAETPEHPGRPEPHPGSPLHERFDHDRIHLRGGRRLHRLERLDRAHPVHG